jgi:hypothetical protein
VYKSSAAKNNELLASGQEVNGRNAEGLLSEAEVIASVFLSRNSDLATLERRASLSAS